MPRASREAVIEAISKAVANGKLWLVAGELSLFAEEVPAGVVTDTAVVKAPPKPIAPTDILESVLPAAWKGNTATARAIGQALEERLSTRLPWITVRNAINSAINARVLVKDNISGAWPCDYGQAEQVILRMPKDTPPPPSGVKTTGVVKLTTGQLQDLDSAVGKLTEAAGAAGIEFEVKVTVGKNRPAKDEEIAKLNALLHEVSQELNL